MNDRAKHPASLEDSAFFMPFSMNRLFKKTPRLMARAKPCQDLASPWKPSDRQR